MSNASSQSLAAILKLADSLPGSVAVEAASGLLAAAGVIERESQLRNLLTDGGRTAQSRSKLSADLFASKINAESVEIINAAVAARWSNGAQLVEVLEQAAYRAMFNAAESENVLDRVEEEIFLFARAVSQNGELQMGLTNPAYDAAAKAKLVENLIGGSAHPYAVKVLAHVAANLRGRRTDRMFEEVVDLAAARRSRLRAKLRTAIKLDSSQRTRLTAALTEIYKKPIQLDEELDTDVIGGIEVRIADYVIDGTIAGRLRQARHQVAG